VTKYGAGLVFRPRGQGASNKALALMLLTGVFTLNSIDRILLGLFLDPIGKDLHLSDSELGFVAGIAFGLFYSVLGLPVARWSDRGNRVSIISLAIGLWGITVISCFFVTNFLQLVCARIAAGVGEAGCMPPTYSLLGDYFPGKRERTRAMTIYWLASPLAGMISFGIGGLIAQSYGWRSAFFVFGVVGVATSIVVRLALIEPRRFDSAARKSDHDGRPISEVIRIIWSGAAARNLSIAIILLYVIALGLGPWYAAFLIRSHGMNAGELGISMGLIFGLSGICGTLAGGFASTRWFADNERGQLRLMSVMTALLVPLFAIFLLVPSRLEALAALAPLMIAFCFFMGPSFALMQRLVDDDMRATAIAIVMLLANLIGMGLGPQCVGIVSDLLSKSVGTDSLRYSMLIVAGMAFWPAWHFWRAGITIADDLGVSELSPAA